MPSDSAAAQAGTRPTLLLPLATVLGRRERGLLSAGLAVLALAVVVTALAGALFGGDGLANLRDWVSSLAYIVATGVVVLRVVRVKEGRGPWILVAAGLALYTAGNLLWVLWVQHLADPPFPSICDALWLSLYPASYVALVWLGRRAGRGASAGVWLDGIVAGLGITAVGIAVLFEPVLVTATGPVAAVATNLAYPIADLILAALVVGILGLRGWRVDVGWGLIGGGFLSLAVADIIYVLYIAEGGLESSLTANAFYILGIGLLALAAWYPPRERKLATLEGWSMIAVPSLFVCAAVGLLVYAHDRDVSMLAVMLAAATVLMATVRMLVTFRDVRALAETRRQAHTDDLTSMPNRRLFMRRAGDAIAAARVTGGSVGLLLIDLDHFKELNDTLGHHAGDLLLAQIGPRLRTQLRSTDNLGRLGGDEFGLVLEAPCEEEDAIEVANKLRAALRDPFEVAGLQLRMTASIGVAMFPAHAGSVEELLQRADVAMYDAKATSTGVEVYARERDTNTLDHLALVAELPRAIEAGEIELHFQPKADARTRQVVGVEALARWRHPERGLIPPTVFVPLAVRGGLGRELTRCVLEGALAACRTWRAAGHDLHVAVNTTVADLLDAGLPADLAATLEHHGLPPGALVIEVTETAILHDPIRIGDVLARVGELGVTVSLDDFGTGFSSLTHLKTLPVSEVKIDRSFVSGMESDPTDAHIVRWTIGLVNGLGLRVVAEGVEDDVTWRRLATLGCDLVQGYGLARPMPASDVLAFLEQWQAEGVVA
jgi:diguanylate cyclase (GGDEF)-like protein